MIIFLAPRLRYSVLARNMVDWEFWGNPKVWKTVGIGFLLVILGIILLWAGVDSVLARMLTLIGGFLMVTCAFYFLFWENWSLLRQRSRPR